jgi:hypothetical protein
MSTIRRAILAGCFATALLAPRPAHADAYDAAISRGIVARDLAIDTNDPAKWNEALQAFDDAIAIRDTKEAQFEKARTARHLHADDIAFAAYEASLVLGLGGKAKDEAEKFLADNASKMARIVVKAPAGATVFIAAHRRGLLPLAQPIVVFAGAVRVRVQTTDGRTAEKDATTTVGATSIVDLTTEFAALTPKTIVQVAPTIDRGPSLRLGRGLIISGSALAVVGFGTYFIAAYQVGKRREDLAQHCFTLASPDVCTDAEAGNLSAAQADSDAIARYKNLRLAGAITGSVGVAVAIAGLVRLVTTPPEGAKTETAFTPELVPRPGGFVMGLQGAF